MAKFPFMVKHNGIDYPAGKEVPIGVEAKKENQVEDKSATEIRQELKEKYGVTRFNGNSKESLIAQLKEAEELAKLNPKADDDIAIDNHEDEKSLEPTAPLAEAEGIEISGKTFLEQVLGE